MKVVRKNRYQILKGLPGSERNIEFDVPVAAGNDPETVDRRSGLYQMSQALPQSLIRQFIQELRQELVVARQEALWRAFNR